MRKAISALLAVLAASICPALAFSLVVFALGKREAIPILALAFWAAALIALAHVVILGLPVILLLIRRGSFQFRKLLIAGAAVGTLPAAVWAWPYRSGNASSSWSDGVQTLAEGIPTWAGWIDYLQFASYAGALGGLGGVAFYTTFRLASPNYSIKGNIDRSD